ncbi:MAG: hypothetical protein H0T05_00695 [Acidobacteria bacterium]|nr:hypothetical protein [Acidobacteriota bacterium]
MSEQPGPPAQGTLLDKLLSDDVGGFGNGPGHGVLEDAVNIDAGEVFAYLRQRTPTRESGPGGDLSVTDFPNCHPEGLGVLADEVFGEQLDFIPPVFLEGSFPADSAVAFDPRPGYPAGVMSTDVESARAGALLVTGEGEPNENNRALPTQPRYVMRCAAYVDLGMTGMEAVGPPLVWAVPLSDEGEVLCQPGDLDLPMSLYGPPEGSDWQTNDGAEIVHQRLRPVLYAALFTVCCANALYESDGKLVRMSNPPEKDHPTLHIPGLAAMLDREGSAGELGLGHALTVCREVFSS